MIRGAYVALRRALIFLVGASILLVGVIMLVTPGPAIVVIPIGLAVLATEFVWARAILEWLKRRIAEHTGTTGGSSRHDAAQEDGPAER